MSGATHILHGTAIAIGKAGIMLLGKSGSGKSDLALRLIDRGAVLVSDDAVPVVVEAGGPQLGAAPNIEGKIEMRGVGIVERPSLQSAPLRLVVHLDRYIERLPSGDDTHNLGGFSIPALALNAFEASAALKVEQRLKTVVDAGLLPVAVQQQSHE